MAKKKAPQKTESEAYRIVAVEEVCNDPFYIEIPIETDQNADLPKEYIQMLDMKLMYAVPHIMDESTTTGQILKRNVRIDPFVCDGCGEELAINELGMAIAVPLGKYLHFICIHGIEDNSCLSRLLLQPGLRHRMKPQYEVDFDFEGIKNKP